MRNPKHPETEPDLIREQRKFRQRYRKDLGGKRMDYKNSGVDIEAGYKSVELMKKHVQVTMRSEVLN